MPVEGLGCVGITAGANGMSVYGEADEGKANRRPLSPWRTVSEAAFRPGFEYP